MRKVLASQLSQGLEAQVPFDTMNTILLQLANGHQRCNAGTGDRPTQAFLVPIEQVSRQPDMGVWTQSAALTARDSGSLPAHVAHGRHKHAAGICGHPQRFPLLT